MVSISKTAYLGTYLYTNEKHNSSIFFYNLFRKEIFIRLFNPLSGLVGEDHDLQKKKHF